MRRMSERIYGLFANDNFIGIVDDFGSPVLLWCADELKRLGYVQEGELRVTTTEIAATFRCYQHYYMPKNSFTDSDFEITLRIAVLRRLSDIAPGGVIPPAPGEEVPDGK